MFEIKLFWHLTVCKQKTMRILNWIAWNLILCQMTQKVLIRRKTNQPTNQVEEEGTYC